MTLRGIPSWQIRDMVIPFRMHLFPPALITFHRMCRVFDRTAGALIERCHILGYQDFWWEA